jgi:cell division protein FtsQ
MWDNAPLLRSAANSLLALSMLAMLFGVIHYVTHQPGLFPLHSVDLATAPDRVVAGAVLQVVRNEVRGNFFTVDIDRLRRSVEKLPWVRRVEIRRAFPGRLVMALEEHQALARWNSAALVNQQGEVFVAEAAQSLPSFTGPEGSSPEVTELYEQFSQQLAPLNLHISKLALSSRHAWQAYLSNDMLLELGRDEVTQRMARFVSAYPYALQPKAVFSGMTGAASGASGFARVRYVDLRYHNGFAVGGTI